MKSEPRIGRWLPAVVGGFLWLTVGGRSGSGADSGLVWETFAGGRSARVAVTAEGKVGFTRLPARDRGLAFTNVLDRNRFTTNQIYLNGSGVAAGDVDGDGRCDLVLGGLGGGTALFHNDGSWHFSDVTAASGLHLGGLDVSGLVLVDVEGDGDLDLVVNTVGQGTHCLINDGRGHFTAGQVLNQGRGGTSLALADLDGDGALDLYVANYRPETLRDQPRTNFRINKVDDRLVVALVNGLPTTRPELAGRFTYAANGGITEWGEPDALFRNDGKGHFLPVSFLEGTFSDAEGRPLTEPLYDWGLSVMIRDLNDDGLPDIYVCNDFISEDRFWLNQGQGRFRAASSTVLRNTSRFSMGLDVADVDRDGHFDLYVLDMLSRRHTTRMTRMDRSMDAPTLGAAADRPQFARSTLQLARGDGTFAEAGQYAGLEATEWSWCPVFLDVDLDGYEDLLVSTGHARDDMHLDYGMRIERSRRTMKLSVADELALRKDTPSMALRKLAFHNLGGVRFEEVGQRWGFGDVAEVAHGMCLADLDNDGDLDVVANVLNGEVAVYRNDAAAARLGIRLHGTGGNARGIGARIEVSAPGLPRQSQEMIVGGRYLSGDDGLRVFAAGQVTNRLNVVVRWRDGRRSVAAGLEPNRIYEFDEALAPATATPPVPAPTPPSAGRTGARWFVDESGRLGHRHYDEPFDDWARQPLLPHRLSQPGPGVAWVDLDRDGRDDLWIAGGKSGRPGVFLNRGEGGFSVSDSEAAGADQTGVVAWTGAEGAPRLLVATSGYETGAGGGLLEVAGPTGFQATLDLGEANLTALAAADVDGDSVLELFVGGGAMGGRYPESTPARILRERDGKWSEWAEATAALRGVGLAQGAIWTDLDGDGFPELVVACEWGPVRVFRNRRGELQEATREWGLGELTGWWRGVTAVDVDNDGRMDLVAGNWGLNSQYRVQGAHGPRLYCGDFGGQGAMDLVESAYDAELARWVPVRDLMTLGQPLPWLRAKFDSHEVYAHAGVEEVLGERIPTARILEAHCLASTVFRNRGDHFEAFPLPAQAQYSPVTGISAGDFDGDGNLDLLLTQNFFPEPRVTSRNDAGRGLVLRGDGRGNFQPVPGQESGFEVYGDQRGSAVGDYDQDGRLDVVITQNSGATMLYHNVGARPGIRVRLRGPAGNASGLGAVVRAIVGGRGEGPAQELHGGGGWWSQDSTVLLFPDRGGSATEFEVRWPGGAISRQAWAAGSNAITLEAPPAKAR